MPHNRILYVSSSLQGVKRDNNQDRTLIVQKDDTELFILFDGVSSLPGSYLFIEEFCRQFKSKLNRLTSNLCRSNLQSILYQLNNEVHLKRDDGLSTLSLLAINKRSGDTYGINIGDSGILAVSNQGVKKLTKPDTLLKNSNILIKCIGLDTLTKEDFKPVTLPNAEKYVLYSDGFYNLYRSDREEFFHAFNFKRLGNTKRKLNRLLAGNNNDDATYIIIKNEV